MSNYIPRQRARYKASTKSVEDTFKTLDEAIGFLVTELKVPFDILISNLSAHGASIEVEPDTECVYRVESFHPDDEHDESCPRWYWGIFKYRTDAQIEWVRYTETLKKEGAPRVVVTRMVEVYCDGKGTPVEDSDETCELRRVVVNG